MKSSLGISNFFEKISHLSCSSVFLYFFALITGFLISPCYSLELCIQMGISFIFSFAFCFCCFPVSFHWSVRKPFFSPCYSLELCIQMDISFLFSFTFCFPSFKAIYKASSESHFAFLHFFFLGMVLITVSCTSHEPLSIVLQALCVRPNPLNVFATSTL